jgi:hypothetical protein
MHPSMTSVWQISKCPPVLWAQSLVLQKALQKVSTPQLPDVGILMPTSSPLHHIDSQQSIF